MKILLFTFSLLLTLPAIATPFAGCAGDHHGTYIDFVTEQGQVFILTSGDGELPSKKWSLHKVTKEGQTLKPKAYSWAIRQAIKANANEEYYGMVLVEARRAGETLFVNLNKPTTEQFVVTNGSVEKLECPLESIAE